MLNPPLGDALQHHGVSIKDGAPGRGSGRYPLGSGEKPFQRPTDFADRVDKMKKEEGKTEAEIARELGISVKQLRAQVSLAKNERRQELYSKAKELKDRGLTNAQIAEELGMRGESSVRSLLNAGSAARMNQAMATADILKAEVENKGFIDVGEGTELILGTSKERLTSSLEILKAEGYVVYTRNVEQATNPGKYTKVTILCPPGTEYRDIYAPDIEVSVPTVDFTSHDGGETYDPRYVYPASMDSSRLDICYGDEGGSAKDGLIEIRRNVDDLSLGDAHYAQVRILVDGTHYLKGMAVYSDDLPEGVDIRFNTNKPSGTPALGPKNDTVLKPIGKDPNNPFGSLIKDGIFDPDDPIPVNGGQSYYYDANGNKQLSLINKRASEGDWGEWADRLPSQFLSKQDLKLINKQLGLAKADKEAEFDEINSLTNPTLKRTLLKKFADECDSAAVHLQAAALPRQKYQVILPLTEVKDTEIYAPGYSDGEKVVLIRYPHGGTFEIPELVVNNKISEGRKVIGTDAKDAVGISAKVAAQLSGADFDGDTVMVIPVNSKIRIKTDPPLKGLEGFDPKLEYGGKPEGTFREMKNTQTEMGVISNLITDMTLKGAPQDDIAKAVRHSMVVIDAEKHHLDYKQSEKDNDISELKRLYQSKDNGRYGGASTLISLAKSQESVPKRRGSPQIDPETGEVSYKTATDLYYTDPKTGKEKMRTQRSTKMAETKDARTLSSGTPQEEAYADYANSMKALANRARKEMVSPGLKSKRSPSAAETYKAEVDSLLAKLNTAKKNAPRERQAQMIAQKQIQKRKADDAEFKNNKKEVKKYSSQALKEAREKVGAKRYPINITDKEWEAIQAGALSDSRLSEILLYTDNAQLKQRAMPRTTTTLSQAKVNKINAMRSSGYTTKEIADAVGVSASTVTKYFD